MSAIKRLYSLINKDISSENETKDLTVLVRILSLVDALYCILYAGLLGSSLDFSAVTVALLFANLNIIVFLTTYNLNSVVTTILHCTILTAFTITFCMLYGNKLGLRFSIFTLIPLLFYRVDFKSIYKILSSSAVFLISTGLGLVSIWDATPVTFARPIIILSIILNTLVLTVKFIVISYFYYKKYADGESKIVSYSKKLEQLANVDALTQLQNRRSMNSHLEHLAENYYRTDGAFSIVICDIDFFKVINDTYGHDAGDYVLVELSAILRNFMEDKGVVARWGGEEFLLAFEGMNGDYVFMELGKLRNLIKSHAFKYKDTTINVTMTFGLEEYDNIQGIPTKISKADEKLYLGKKRGRDCVIY